MAQLLSVIRPVPGADGPFYVVTDANNSTVNVTTGVLTLGAALDVAKSDQGANLGGGTVARVEIKTTVTDPP